jgi:hypothetical protein
MYFYKNSLINTLMFFQYLNLHNIGNVSGI